MGIYLIINELKYLNKKRKIKLSQKQTEDIIDI